jgi:hypothetical protein
VTCRAAGPGPSEETLRQFGIDPEERRRNLDERDRQLSVLVDAALEAERASEPAESAAASQPDGLELAERFAKETARLDAEREAHRIPPDSNSTIQSGGEAGQSMKGTP